MVKRYKKFSKIYKAFPLSHLPKYEENTIFINGGKIILPEDDFALLHSARGGFKKTHTILRISTETLETHVGILEFTSPQPDSVYMPDWMFENLSLEIGGEIEARLVTLKAAKHLRFKFEPEFKAEVTNPEEVLEVYLKGFAALTTEDNLVLSHKGKDYKFVVVETKPKGQVRLPQIGKEVTFDLEFYTSKCVVEEEKEEGVQGQGVEEGQDGPQVEEEQDEPAEKRARVEENLSQEELQRVREARVAVFCK